MCHKRVSFISLLAKRWEIVTWPPRFSDNYMYNTSLHTFVDLVLFRFWSFYFFAQGAIASNYLWWLKGKFITIIVVCVTYGLSNQASFHFTSIRTGCWSPPRKCAPLRTSGRNRPLRGTQHSFHDTNRETLNKARPQVVTNRDNRLTDTSGDKREQKTRWTVNTFQGTKQKHRKTQLTGGMFVCTHKEQYVLHDPVATAV